METSLNFEGLKKNLTEIIKESQIKLGYVKEPVRLYYPIESLNHLLDSKLDAKDMEAALLKFSSFARDTLGNLSFSRTQNRFCILIPEDGVEYVQKQTPDTDFLKTFIRTIERHGLTLSDILDVFYRYSDHVACEEIKSDDFDYLIYFEDGQPDDFRYCIKFEGEHAIYHRFTPKDYEDFGFQILSR